MLSGFVRGFGHGLSGIAWLRREPTLRRYWVPPVVISMLVFVVLQAAALRYSDALLAALWARPDPGAHGCGDQGLVCWFLAAVYWLAGAVSWLVAALLAALSSFVISVVVAAPFHDALSEATERLTGRGRPLAFSAWAIARDALRSVVFELAKWAAFVAVLGPLWVLSWVAPGPGQLLYAAISSVLAAAYFALDFTDWPASRRDWTIRRRLALLRSQPGPMLGFGASVWLLLFVPVVSLFLVPAAVIGGTRLFLELEGEPDSEQIP